MLNFKFSTFERWEGTTTIEQVQTKGRGWSIFSAFFDNVIIECPIGVFSTIILHHLYVYFEF